ncbi:MAG: hypothetical protein ACLPPF_24150 [Rhodomicrobium sp.]
MTLGDGGRIAKSAKFRWKSAESEGRENASGFSRNVRGCSLRGVGKFGGIPWSLEMFPLRSYDES